ncbi:hypothetical protein ABI_24910 [Asticcacaulis biprosthecium C19]|uniref:Uncharacterized protein n=1 Tax=Asticcacaulis biprosthecium C19 TaxID=715226 RepID=F4QP20_9CAUL|nr:hypothetical protein ABI_24910 [Asticcacaulis biprosthecium C19]
MARCLVHLQPGIESWIYDKKMLTIEWYQMAAHLPPFDRYMMRLTNVDDILP